MALRMTSRSLTMRRCYGASSPFAGGATSLSRHAFLPSAVSSAFIAGCSLPIGEGSAAAAVADVTMQQRRHASHMASADRLKKAEEGNVTKKLSALCLPRHRYTCAEKDSYRMPHATYEPKVLEAFDKYNSHREPRDLCDTLARLAVSVTRRGYDFFSRYNSYNHDLKGAHSHGDDDKTAAAAGAPKGVSAAAAAPTGPLMPADMWVTRAIFLETVAAVPGMVAGMLRHMRSLRLMERDNGWIHALLEEAENERMHLFFFLKQKDPGLVFRLMVTGAQGVFLFINVLGFIISPRFMHRFVGYVEEQALHTYTTLMKDIDRGVPEGCDPNTTPSDLPANHISHWRTKPAPKDYIQYYGLPPTATYRDVILCIRADELGHREHNHLYADAILLKMQDQVSDLLKQSQHIGADELKEALSGASSAASAKATTTTSTAAATGGPAAAATA